MPARLRHNERFELNIADYSGTISFAELEAMAGYLATNPTFLKRDCLSVVRPGARFEVELYALDQLFGRYTTLYEPIGFQIIRRSAWICQSPAAQAHVDYWIGGRDTHSELSTTLRQFNTIAEAGDWFALTEAETIALQTGAGFTELARFDTTSLGR